MKENRFVALHVACGNITDVEAEGNKLVILSEDATMRSIINDGKRDIERALTWQGLDWSVEVKEKIIPPTKQEEDIKILKEMFGNKLEIKE